MYSEEAVLKNETGLHTRPASLFVKKASRYVSSIKVIKDTKQHNAKSIMGILSMGIGMGDKVIIEAVGEDETRAVKDLVKFVNNEFQE